MKLACSVAGASDITAVTVSAGHTLPSTTAVVQARTHSFEIGDAITAYLGYDPLGSGDKIFSGYVKQIEHRVPDDTYVITANDKLVQALDFFIVASDPAAPFSRSNIAAEDLVAAVLALAGLTNLNTDSPNFTFGITSPVEVNLVSAYDFSKMIADILAYSLWADRDGVVHFKNRRPYPMVGDSAIATLDTNTHYNTLQLTYRKSERDLRNKVVVYGSGDIAATAQASSPYLPAGFYKAVVVASPWINTLQLAQNAADWNLDKLNRLTEEVFCEVIGDNTLDARKVVTLSDATTNVGGDWYIYGCEHRWSQAGYTTSLELRR